MRFPMLRELHAHIRLLDELESLTDNAPMRGMDPRIYSLVLELRENAWYWAGITRPDCEHHWIYEGQTTYGGTPPRYSYRCTKCDEYRSCAHRMSGKSEMKENQ